MFCTINNSTLPTFKKKKLNVLLFPGFMGNGQDLMPLFHKKYFFTPITYQLPVPNTFSNAVKNCQSIIKNLPNSICCGYSFGGRLLFGALAQQSKHIKAAIIISSAPYTEHKTQKKVISKELINRLKKDSPIDFLTFWTRQHLFGNLHEIPNFSNYIANRLLNFNSNLYIDMINYLSIMPDFRSKLSNCHVPTLLVAGEKDHKYVTYAHECATLMPKATVALIKNASHACYLEQPKQVFECIQAFLNRLQTNTLT